MQNFSIKPELLNKIVVFLIGILSAGYFFYGVPFAEVHIILPFLDFPIFVGEICLAICLVIFFINFKHHHILFGKRGWTLCALYILFVLGKAGWGYGHEGPLALRHAALFYYPLFCLMGYAAFRKEFCNEGIKTALIVLLLVILASRHYFRLHVFVAVILSVLLVMSLSQVRLRVLWLILLAIFLPYKHLFLVSRAELLSIFAGMSFIIFLFFKILNLKRRTKGFIGLAIICFFGFAFSLVENKSNLLSFVKVQEIISSYRKDKKFINAKIASFQPIEISAVKLFNKEASRFQGREYLKIYENLLENEVERILIIEEKSGHQDQMPVSSALSDSFQQEIHPDNLKNQSSGDGNEYVEMSQISEDQNTIALLQDSPSIEGIDAGSERKVFNHVVQPIKPRQDSIERQVAIIERPLPLENLEEVHQIISNQKEEFADVQGEIEPAFESSPPPITADQSLKEQMQREGMDINKMADIFPKEEDKYLFYLKYKVINELFAKYPLDPSLQKGLLIGYPDVRMRVTKDLEKYFHMQTIDEKVVLVSRIVEDLGWKKEELSKKTALELILIRRRTLDNAISNTLFRLYLWEDAFKQLMAHRAIIGMNFGHPFRSTNIEVLNRASGEWSRDGWVSMHNSYIEIIYRSGVLGIVFIFIFLKAVLSIIVYFFRLKFYKGILLSAALIYWMVMAGFAVVFEIPYQAISFWSLLGMTMAYRKSLMS